MQGRSVLTMEKQFITGLNTINIDRIDLPSCDIYVWKIHLGG